MSNNAPTLRDIMEVCNRLEDKMDGRMRNIESDVEELQKGYSKMMGVFSAISIFTASLASFVWSKIFKG